MDTIQQYEDDRRRLARVLARARQFGWQPPAETGMGLPWRHEETGVEVDVDSTGLDARPWSLWVRFGPTALNSAEVEVRDLTEAVDVLVAWRLLPPDLSSAWKAGFAAACSSTYLRLPWVIEPLYCDGKLVRCPCCGDDLWCGEALAESAAELAAAPEIGAGGWR